MGSNHIFAIYMISLSGFSVVDKQRWQLKAIFPLCVAIFQNYNQEKSLMAHLLFFLSVYSFINGFAFFSQHIFIRFLSSGMLKISLFQFYFLIKKNNDGRNISLFTKIP